MIEDKRKIVTQILGNYWQKGDEHLYHCPYCKHHKKKMSVNFANGFWKCWVCDMRGKNVYRIVRKFGSYQQREKYRELQGMVDLSDFEQLFKEYNEIEDKQIIELPKEFISLCNKDLPMHSTERLRYLSSRGLTRLDILKWKIGYCKEGRYAGRILIPSFDMDGDCNYFIARSYVGHSYRYLNPPADRDLVFNELMVDWDEPIILVEGVFDALVAGNAVPILGSTLRKGSDLLRQIVRNDTPIYIALDPDAAAKERRIIKMLLEYDVELYKIDVTGYEDVGSMPKKVFTERKNKASFIDRDNYLLLDLLSAV